LASASVSRSAFTPLPTKIDPAASASAVAASGFGAAGFAAADFAAFSFGGASLFFVPLVDAMIEPDPLPVGIIFAAGGGGSTDYNVLPPRQKYLTAPSPFD
jgi:hypothetical protein